MSNRLLHKSVIHEDATPSTRWIDGSNTTTNIIAAIILVLAAFLPVGGLYWVWIAANLGSPTMVVLGILAGLVTWPIGVYMLLVGVPSWVVMVFG
jgi:hypothetical protein